MNEIISKIPNWLLLTLIIFLAALVGYSVVSGHKVDLGVVTISPMQESPIKEDNAESPQIWKFAEGTEREWSVEWKIPAFGEAFDCVQHHKKDSSILTAKCVVIKSGNYYAAKKYIVTPDKNSCNYFGIGQQNSISGTYFCRKGGDYKWRVTIISN